MLWVVVCDMGIEVEHHVDFYLRQLKRIWWFFECNFSVILVKLYLVG